MSPLPIHFILSSSRRRSPTSIPPSLHLSTYVHFAPIRPYHNVRVSFAPFDVPVYEKCLNFQPFLRWQRRQVVGRTFSIYLSYRETKTYISHKNVLYCIFAIFPLVPVLVCSYVQSLVFSSFSFRFTSFAFVLAYCIRYSVCILKIQWIYIPLLRLCLGLGFALSDI
jgi:hypothetical protein